MKTSLKEILTNMEEQKKVPFSARHALEKKLFRPSLWRGSLLITASALGLAVCAFVFLPASPMHPLTPQEVLAKALQNSTLVPQGSLFIMTTNIAKDGAHVVTQVLSSDGTHVRLQSESEENIMDTWYERAGSDLVEVYSVDPDTHEVQHTTNELMPPASWPEGAMFSQDGETAWVNMCDDENNCKELSISKDFLPEEGNAQQEMTMNFTADEEGHIAITGVVGRFAANNVQSLTREFFVDPETMRITKRTWHAVLEDGTESNGEMIYTYETVPLAELGHDFSLAWWKGEVGAQE